MTRYALPAGSWLLRHRSTYLVIAAILCVNHVCIASDAMHTWTIVIHKQGRETFRKEVPTSNLLHEEIEKLSGKGSAARSRIDLVTYAPSIRLESDLERIELRARMVVYSNRKTIDDAWQQRSRHADEADRSLRQRVEAFAVDADGKP